MKLGLGLVVMGIASVTLVSANAADRIVFDCKSDPSSEMMFDNPGVRVLITEDPASDTGRPHYTGTVTDSNGRKAVYQVDRFNAGMYVASASPYSDFQFEQDWMPGKSIIFTVANGGTRRGEVIRNQDLVCTK